jgi:hypothetical protein
MILSTVFGITLLGYLNLVGSQYRFISRSQVWNEIMPFAEAGVEEALAHINYSGVGNLSGDGWELIGTNYVKSVDLSSGAYKVWISNDSNPIIYSEGRVASILAPEDFKRMIRVTTQKNAMFMKGMVAKDDIDLNGNNVETDSFDSKDPTASTGGFYDPSKRKSNGDVATNSSLANRLRIGNANIIGRVSTGPGGSISIGSNGAVGSAEWHADGNSGIMPGWSSDDMNVDFADITLPFTAADYPTSGTVNGENYTYVLGNGNYQLGGFSLSGQKKMAITGNAVLLVTSDISMAGQAAIEIKPGASLTIYMTGSSAKFAGQGIVNEGGNALDFAYYGMPSNSEIKLSGNAGFVGTIYALNAALTLGGGGSDTSDFIGASVTGSVKMNGHFNFHYDENLGREGPGGDFVATSWHEINENNNIPLPDYYNVDDTDGLVLTSAITKDSKPLVDPALTDPIINNPVINDPTSVLGSVTSSKPDPEPEPDPVVVAEPEPDPVVVSTPDSGGGDDSDSSPGKSGSAPGQNKDKKK